MSQQAVRPFHATASSAASSATMVSTSPVARAASPEVEADRALSFTSTSAFSGVWL